MKPIQICLQGPREGRRADLLGAGHGKKTPNMLQLSQGLSNPRWNRVGDGHVGLWILALPGPTCYFSDRQLPGAAWSPLRCESLCKVLSHSGFSHV